MASTQGPKDYSFYGSNKLLQHLDRLLEWRQTGNSSPISVGIDITNLCNHKCPMCNGAPGMLDSRAHYPFEAMLKLTEQMVEAGIKSVALGGGGDATCHPNFIEIIRNFKAHGLEIGLFTNGQLLRPEAIEAVVECCTFARVSLDADGPELFHETHGMAPRDWDKVLSNVRALVDMRARTGSPITLGTSFLIGSHTHRGIHGVAKVSKELGVDYVRIRPFFTWHGKLPFTVEEAELVVSELARARQDFDAPDFKVSYPAVRTEWVKEAVPPGRYKKCHVHHFSPQITADQKMHVCCHTKHGFGDKYCLGDLTKNTVKEIWNSEARRKVYENIDFADCAKPCQLTEHNELLDLIDTPIAHSNFI